MTMTEERAPFEPIGDVGRAKMILEGIALLPPLEAGTVITHEMISDWLGEPFPIPRQVRGGVFLVPDYGPMNEVRSTLLKKQRVLLVPEANIGWRVATDAEKAAEAEALWRKAAEVLAKSSLVARTVNRSRISDDEADRLGDVSKDVAAARKLLAAQEHARAEKRRKFGTDW
ncbi:MAG: hypothetical protein AB7G17_14215 [Phycisphaerales bacterium]